MLYRFGEFEIDERLFHLRGGGVVLHVQPKVLDLLLLLAKAGDRVVLKPEIHKRLWPGVQVSEAALTRLVVEARRVIGDEGQQVLVTVRSRGFRLGLPVTRSAPARSEGFDEAPSSAVKAPASSAVDPPFVGRALCLAVAATTLKRAHAGAGGMAWVSGERGIGKSSVLARIGRHAESLGFRVGAAQARRNPDAPPLWLWREALPDLAAAVPLIASGAVPAGAAQFSLFDAVAHHLVNATKSRPLALLLDDLHWADRESLQLLEFLAPAVGRWRMAVFGTYSEASAPPGPRGQALLDALGHSSAITIPLRPLSLDEISRLAETTSAFPPSADFARTLLERSGGNPLYAQQILATDWARRSLTVPAEDQPSTMDLQPDFFGVVSEQMARVSPPALELLAGAAVLGRRLDVAKLVVLSGLPAGELLARLDELVSVRILRKGEDRQLQFAHGLVRDVIYKRMSSAERSRRHAEAAQKLLSHYGKSYEGHLQELAHQFALALPEGDVEKAIELTMRVAAREAAAERPLVAAKYWQHAARGLALLPGGDPRQLDVALGLAEAWRAAGREPQAREAFQDAEILKRVLGR